MNLALQTNTHIWKDAFTRSLDATVIRHHVHLVKLPWHAFELLPDDTDHFTWKGLEAFCHGLATALAPLQIRNLSIYADSTVDYWNRDHNWDSLRSRPADALLAKALREVGIVATVDSVCGSGYVARREYGEDFASRRTRGRTRNESVLVIGGWNDASHDAVEQGVAAFWGKLDSPHRNLNATTMSQLLRHRLPRPRLAPPRTTQMSSASGPG